MFGKKRFLLTAALLLGTVLTGCGKDGDTSAEQTAPGTEMFETGYPAFFSEEDNEQDYSNIVCYSEQEVYPADTEWIYITVENRNKRKGFWVCDLAYIEKNIGGEWVRIEYDEEFYNNIRQLESENWGYCYIEETEFETFSTRVSVLTERLAEPLTEGDYRAVVFVGKETLYAPFKIEN